MDWKAIREELSRLTALVDGWCDGKVSALERDLALEKLRMVYETIRFADMAAASAKQPEAMPVSEPEPVDTQEKPAESAHPAEPETPSEPAEASEPAAGAEPEPETPAAEVEPEAEAAPQTTLFDPEEDETMRHRRKQRVILSLYGAEPETPAESSESAAFAGSLEPETEPAPLHPERPVLLERKPVTEAQAESAVTFEEIEVETVEVPSVEPEPAPQETPDAETVSEEAASAESESESPVQPEREPEQQEEEVSESAAVSEPMQEPESEVEKEPEQEQLAEPLINLMIDALEDTEIATESMSFDLSSEESVETAASDSDADAEEPLSDALSASEFEINLQIDTDLEPEAVPETESEQEDESPLPGFDAGMEPLQVTPVLGEVINHDVQTLADTIAAPEDVATSLLRHEAIADLRQVIGLNDRFLFINELFGGDSDAYERTMQQLNSFDNLDDCMIYLAENYTWNPDAESVRMLMELLERKFA